MGGAPNLKTHWKPNKKGENPRITKKKKKKKKPPMGAGKKTKNSQKNHPHPPKQHKTKDARYRRISNNTKSWSQSKIELEWRREIKVRKKKLGRTKVNTYTSRHKNKAKIHHTKKR